MSEEEEVLNKCVELLEEIITDKTVPRNIRRSANKVKKELTSRSDSLAVRATSAISSLDSITNDPNIPFHTRTLIWNIISQLETISVEK